MPRIFFHPKKKRTEKKKKTEKESRQKIKCMHKKRKKKEKRIVSGGGAVQNARWKKKSFFGWLCAQTQSTNKQPRGLSSSQVDTRTSAVRDDPKAKQRLNKKDELDGMGCDGHEPEGLNSQMSSLSPSQYSRRVKTNLNNVDVELVSSAVNMSCRAGYHSCSLLRMQLMGMKMKCKGGAIRHIYMCVCVCVYAIEKGKKKHLDVTQI